MYLYRGHLARVLLRKGEGVDKESNKKTQKGEYAVKKVISVTQILLCTFSVTQSFLLGF